MQDRGKSPRKIFRMSSNTDGMVEMERHLAMLRNGSAQQQENKSGLMSRVCVGSGSRSTLSSRKDSSSQAKPIPGPEMGFTREDYNWKRLTEKG